MEQRTILVVEDNKDLREYLVEFLQDSGFVVQGLAGGSQVMNIIEKTKVDLVILDLGLPDIEGEDLCRQIKKLYPDLPVIILTAREGTASIVRNLGFGADDYMTKPFSSDELLARIKSRLKKLGNGIEPIEVGKVKLDPKTAEVSKEGKQIRLTHTEFQLLHYLMQNKNILLTRDMILNHVWSYTPDVESRVVDVYVGYLRKKLKDEGKDRIIHSKRGFGYILKEPGKN